MKTVAKRFTELTTAELYVLLKLRVDIFVVEQGCAYAELDGRDTEPDTLHLWHPGDGTRPLAYLRILNEPDAARIGRVLTTPEARGQGFATALMTTALERCAGRRVDIEAQTYLTDWYSRFGFHVVGEEFLDEGIPHVEMRRAAC